MVLLTADVSSSFISKRLAESEMRSRPADGAEFVTITFHGHISHSLRNSPAIKERLIAFQTWRLKVITRMICG